MAITLDGTTGITLPASGDIINASMIQSDTSNPPTFQNSSGTELGSTSTAPERLEFRIVLMLVQ